MTHRSLYTDCLVIGSGIGGLCTALQLSKLGIRATIISAAPQLIDTNTGRAQGGIIFKSATESPKRLIRDILEAGCHLNYVPSVKQLAEMGPMLVEDILLNEINVPFDRSPEGNYHLTREGGHKENRILHRGDESGASIQDTLLRHCQKQELIKFLTSTTAINLLMTSYHDRNLSARHHPTECFGAFVFDQHSQEAYPIFARHTVLATGGLGQLFLHSTNGKFARGDGIALAYRAGCRLENLEFIQFHPTTFFHPQSRRFLITEALRGEGAILTDANGNRFLSKYLKDYSVPELAPRDRVARAIHHEMLSQGLSHVYLDISHKPKEWIEQRFPFVYRNCLTFGVDISKQPIPVVPGAHYHCGGVWTDLEGKTSIPNLWAVGEVASTGVHGANRLASTSLLEGLVWGTLAGKGIANSVQQNPDSKLPDIDPWKHETAHVDPAFLNQDWQTLKQTMWNYVGLIKTDARLTRAAGILGELDRGINSFYQKALLSDELIGLRHATQAALLILRACQRNPKSLGCYLREELEI